MGLWPADAEDDDDEWFNGRVLAVDSANRTCHIKYDDQDEDDEVPWDNVRILENLDGWQEYIFLVCNGLNEYVFSARNWINKSDELVLKICTLSCVECCFFM